MDDCQIDIAEMEAVKVGSYLGSNIPKNRIDTFIWQKDQDMMSISISVEGQEECIIEISNKGNKIIKIGEL